MPNYFKVNQHEVTLLYLLTHGSVARFLAFLFIYLIIHSFILNVALQSAKT